MDKVTAIILAAGKGTRMNSTDRNKVSLPVNGKPMILRTIEILRSSGINKFVVVVGFAKESVVAMLDSNISIAEQKEQLGTGHAVMCALNKVDKDTKDVLIIYGDDSFLHTPKTFQKLFNEHSRSNAKISFITKESENPTGFGRIIRDVNGEIVGIVEEKNATDEQKLIKEINLGCYVIDRKYLEDNIKNIEKNSVTGEFYITDIIDIISKQKGKISSYKLSDGVWKGVNTPQDLMEAEKILSNGSKVEL